VGAKLNVSAFDVRRLFMVYPKRPENRIDELFCVVIAAAATVREEMKRKATDNELVTVQRSKGWARLVVVSNFG
jgi:hypothetical protein